MQPLNESTISTIYGEKKISVFNCDLLDFDQEIDILTTSAFYRSYDPTPRTLFAALFWKNISVQNLARHPEIDFRDFANIWLSKKIEKSPLSIGRIGCVEMTPYTKGRDVANMVEEKMLASLRAYFQMLDMASNFGVKMDSVALPLLGAGSQKISSELTLIPILNECIDFLKRNSAVKRIYMIEKSPAKAFQMAMALEKSYTVIKEKQVVMKREETASPAEELAFISYSSSDKNVADNLCAKLEANGIKVWYAPRNIESNDYASSIVHAIAKCRYFIVIISENSLMSQHVLNEIDLAFKELDRNVRFLPLRIDQKDMAPAFKYYLSRQHWMDAHVPPIEQRLDEFVQKIINSK